MPAKTARDLSRAWTGRLSTYRRHRNDEHLQALVYEASRYCGLYLENDLSHSAYWGTHPLSRRAAVVLYLVDSGVVGIRSLNGRRVFEPVETAEEWVLSQPSLVPYLTPVLDLVSALRKEIGRRSPRKAA